MATYEPRRQRRRRILRRIAGRREGRRMATYEPAGKVAVGSFAGCRTTDATTAT